MSRTAAVDLAKSLFQVAVANRAGRVVERRRLSRPEFAEFPRTLEPAQVVMEACGTAQHWGRVAQQAGHRVSLLPPRYVRPYVRRDKTDRADAEVLLEALRNPAIAPVPVNSVAQQELVALHRIRRRWMATRTARLNVVRGVLREHGITLPVGARRALRELPLPVIMREVLVTQRPQTLGAVMPPNAQHQQRRAAPSAASCYQLAPLESNRRAWSRTTRNCRLLWLWRSF